MIRMRSKLNFRPRRVIDRTHRANVRALRIGGAYLRRVAQNSIKTRRTASAPGSPPHTRRRRLKNAILYNVEPDHERVLIGPAASMIRQVGSTHEFGKSEPPKFREPNWKLQLGGHGPVAEDGSGEYIFVKLRSGQQVSRAQRLAPGARRVYLARFRARQRAQYPARPFMGPALLKTQPRLPRLWANSIHE